MTDKRNEAIDTILEESDRLLAEIESLDLPNYSSQEGSPSFDRKLQEQSIKKLSVGPLEERDGYVTIQMSPDEMWAEATFHPPVGEGAEITPLLVERTLNQYGLQFGVDETAIRNALERANRDRERQESVRIARGRKPKAGWPAYIALNKKLAAEPTEAPATPAAGDSLDYKDLSPFIVVKKGTALAKKMPPYAGTPGKTVKGRVLPPSTRAIKSPIPRDNVVAQGDYFYAAVDGRLEWDGETFSVNPVLELKNDVDYATGHIEFPGDVILHQGVKDGFRVHAGGSVICMKTLDASDVECDGDLIARQGIIGRNRAKIEVGGAVRAKYIENCHVEAGKDIFADVGIVNSHINTTGSVHTGTKGVVVGGVINALSGIQVFQLGTLRGPRTEVSCGIDFRVTSRIEWIQERITEIAFQIQRVQVSKANGRSNLAELDETEKKLAETRNRLVDAAAELVFRVDRNEEAAIDVSGTVHAGAVIEICHYSRSITREKSGRRFTLEKESGSIVDQPIPQDAVLTGAR